LTKTGGLIPLEGDDGRFVYYVKEEASGGIWRVPADGGEEEPVLPHVRHWEWCLWNGNIVYINQKAENGPAIEMLNLATLERIELVSLGPQALTSAGLTISPDGRWILFAQLDVGGDLMLVENFN
jgi:hypothetical protein